ncbi:MAG: peptidoglycan-binding protein, partial [Candidatus Wildermuthbacteria bacterium]|nr:peptidoglycan-binding protein [Candidatus Wildermuthbacteria bacterium]
PQGTFSRYAFSLPRYFAIFFNLGAESGSLTIQQKSFRKALAQSVDSGAIIQRVLRGNADPVSSPLLPSLFGLTEPGQKASYDLAQAEALLKSLGYKKEQGVWMRPAQKKTTGIQGVLTSGSKGSEVKKLQECLAKDSGIYPSGKISGTFDAATKDAVIKFQEQYAQDILAPQGLTKGTGKVAGGTKAKLNEICYAATDAIPLTLTLTTIDQPPLKEVAIDVADQWKAFGIETEVKLYSAGEIERDIIKPRNYEMLLFGEILGPTPDLFPYWHSTQKADPGLNLAEYGNPKVDALLESARKEMDQDKRTALLEKIQDALVADVPAIFLHDAHYLYLAPSAVQGIEGGMIADPSKRFSGIADWYINTKREWK